MEASGRSFGVFMSDWWLLFGEVLCNNSLVFRRTMSMISAACNFPTKASGAAAPLPWLFVLGRT